MTAAPSTPLDLDRLKALAQRALASVGQGYEEQYSAVSDLEDALEPSIVLALIAAACDAASLRAQLEAMTKERDAYAKTWAIVEPQANADAAEIALLRAQLDTLKADLSEAKHHLAVSEHNRRSERDETNRVHAVLAAAAARERTLIGLVYTAREALDGALAFVSDERETRETSMLCEGETENAEDARYVLSARETESAIRAALTKLNEATK
jgi:uncharacterized protein YijF (DUF1287 family)